MKNKRRTIISVKFRTALRQFIALIFSIYFLNLFSYFRSWLAVSDIQNTA